MLDKLFAQDMWFFTFAALIGGGVFLFKLAMMGIGDVLSGAPGGDGAGIDAIDSDASHGVDADFGLLSTQAVAAFLMGFGTGGLAARIGFELTLPVSVAIGTGFGIFLVWLMAIVMRSVYALQSTGNIHPRDAVGRTGVVYASVPAHGSGRGMVRIVIDDRARTYNAISAGEPLPTGSAVRVTALDGEMTLIVSPA